MRRPVVRYTSFALIGLGCVVLTQFHHTRVVAQAAAPDADGPQAEGYQAFTFPEERDAKQRLQAVVDYLEKKTVPWDVVCGTAQQLLDSKSDSFFPVHGEKGDESGRVSIKVKVNDLIGALPKDGRQFYELTYGPSADALLKEAVAAGYEKVKLAELSQRYFHTQAGAHAALLLAGVDLEAGNYPEAAYQYQRLLARPDAEDFATPRTLLKSVIAFQRSGDPRRAEDVGRLLDRLQKKYPRDGLAIGRRTFSFDELKQELTKPVGGQFGGADRFVSMTYGNASRTGVGTGGTPFLAATFSAPMLPRRDGVYKDGADWVDQNLTDTLKLLDRGKGQVALPAFFPVTAPNLVIYRTYDGVYAIASRDGYESHGDKYHAGDVVWMSPTKGGLQSLIGDTGRQTVQGWWQGFWQKSMPTVLFENSAVGTLSHDGKLVYYVDDLAVPPPQLPYNPNMGGVPQPAPGTAAGSGELGGMTDYNRLVALHLDTGKVVWDLGGLATAVMSEQEEQKSTNTLQLTENAFFLGAPLPVNGKLYTLFERGNQLKLACLDPYRVTTVPPTIKGEVSRSYPELVWSQNLGSPNTKLAQDSLRRIQPTYLAYADGVIVCPTNCGAIVAVDVNARSLLWAKYYTAGRPIGFPGSVRPFGADPNTGPFAVPRHKWRTSAPLIANGRVVLTAPDMDRLVCLDLRTGTELWSDDRQKDDLYVAGVIENNVLVIGKDSARAYDLTGGPDKKPQLAWQNRRIGTPVGHGVASTGGVYYLPVVGNPDEKDSTEPQVWAIQVADGKIKSKTTFRQTDLARQDSDPRLALGNLVFHDGQMFSQSAAEVRAFPLIELKKQEMDRLLAKNPKDPRGLTDRGELFLDNGKLREAIADFKEAQKNHPADDVARTIRQKLYLAYTELLRNDFSSAEPVLAEYEALCEVSVDTDDPTARRRLMDEQLRRRGLFLALVAKGREKQGRLVEAFERYREFATLGGNKDLVAIPDEPGGQTRPDVWARGRIDAMVRGADPTARAPLQDRVRQEWEALKSANDLRGLREFVRVFGPYFREGQEAKFLFAERLLQTNNEEDAREAQIQLTQLCAADAPSVEARAVEALARLMKRRGRLEDAVGLYAQLGTRYANVIIRDGKSGADIYGELLTDRTLLPYLEPASGPQSSRYKLDVQTGFAGRQLVQGFSVRPEGEASPLLRRFYYALQSSPAGDRTWHLVLTDKYTGEEYARFPTIYDFLTRGFAKGPPTYRMAQVCGDLVLLTAGQYAYCFDIARKDELWRYPLLGNTTPTAQGLKTEEQPDGSLVFYTEDGWSLRLDRASVLEAGYVCLATRDGLVALDPYTGEKLWVRSNVSPKLQVFGDAHYVFLMEGATSRVIRAVDGTVVAGVPEFAQALTSPARVASLGRHVLLGEGAGEQPKVLRLYDPLTGADVWRREFPPGSLILRSQDPEFTGCLMPDGAVEIVAAKSGKTILMAGVAERDRAFADGPPDLRARLRSHLRNEEGAIAVTDPVILADAERMYVILNRATNPGQVLVGGQTYIRSQPVNGVAYAFDKATGRRLWFADKLFESQTLLTERFADLPVLVLAAQTADPKTGAQQYRVAVLDKQRGKLEYYKPHQAGGLFQTVFSDPKSRSVEFWRHDLRIRILPEEANGEP